MFTKRDMSFFDMAGIVARASEHKKAKMAAVIVNNGNIMSVGINSYKSHPLQKKYDAFRNHEVQYHNMHAEIAAISKVKNKKDLRGASIYVNRVNKDPNCTNFKQFNMSRPCISCLQALADFGIRRIFYTSYNGYVFENLENVNE